MGRTNSTSFQIEFVNVARIRSCFSVCLQTQPSSSDISIKFWHVLTDLITFDSVFRKSLKGFVKLFKALECSCISLNVSWSMCEHFWTWKKNNVVLVFLIVLACMCDIPFLDGRVFMCLDTDLHAHRGASPKTWCQKQVLDRFLIITSWHRCAQKE